jgi:hypothetical protein
MNSNPLIKLFKTLGYVAHYRARELRYQYYDLVDATHDVVAEHPAVARKCGIAFCGLLGGAAASLILAVAFRPHDSSQA